MKKSGLAGFPFIFSGDGADAAAAADNTASEEEDSPMLVLFSRVFTWLLDTPAGFTSVPLLFVISVF